MLADIISYLVVENCSPLREDPQIHNVLLSYSVVAVKMLCLLQGFSLCHVLHESPEIEAASVTTNKWPVNQ